MNLGDYIAALKPFLKRRRMPDVEFVNYMLQPLVDAASIKDKYKNDLDLDKYRVSRIIHHKDDVPEALRRPLDMDGLDSRLSDGFLYFYETYIDTSKETLLTEKLTRTVHEDSTFSVAEKEYILSGNNISTLLLRLFLCAIKQNNKFNSSDDVIWARGTSYIKFVRGDIFRYGFDKRNKKNRIVVIPVNTTFETRLSDDIEFHRLPLVSRESIHGSFLNRLYLLQLTPKDISDRITANLRINGYSSEDNAPGDFPIGTIAALQFDNVIFYLLAVSIFDENNVARSDKDKVSAAVDCLAEYYDNKGLGYDMYVPLIGTGLSRAYMSNQESFNVIKDSLLKNKDKLQGKINIVVLPEYASPLNIKEDTV